MTMNLELKYCKGCNRNKLVTEFWKRRGKPRVLCSVCDAKKMKEWGKANPDKIKAHDRAKNYKVKYGITVADYDRILAAQGGVCALCQGLEILDRHYCVDHNHTTGIVRGLLCYRCNSGLGVFGDDIEGLQRVVEYLKGSANAVLST